MADATRARLDELIAQNPEHTAMLRQLEQAWEQAEPATDTPFAASDLPSGDELMAELEQFLRDQRPDG
jgi:ferric-dicitrate binding protein FerR (iron transport regulator)